MGNKFIWLPTECAPEKYPMQIVNANFICDDGQAIYIPNGRMICNGWGNKGSIHINGERQKSIPKRLEITWFSFTEDKFFSGSFDLPKEKITELFSKGFVSPLSNKNATYTNILVGLAPGGIISIWLIGEKISTLVCLLKAQSANLEWATFVSNPSYQRSNYINEKLKQVFSKEDFISLRENGIPFGTWDRKYITLYSWKPTIVTTSNPTSIHFTYFDGEREYLNLTANTTIEVLKRPAIQTAILKWENALGKKYRAEIFFNEDEIFHGFAKVMEVASQSEIELQFLVNSVDNSVAVSFKNEMYILELKNSDTKLYSD